MHPWVRAVSRVALALACCATVGHGNQFDAEAVRSLEVGTTTREEVASALGEPSSKSWDEDKRELWMYVYPRSGLRASPAVPPAAHRTTEKHDTRSEILTLRFDGDTLVGIECGVSSMAVPQT